MMTPAELFRELLKPDGRPDRLLKQYEALHIIFANPLDDYLMANRIKGGPPSVDRWGTQILFPADAPGAMPHITPENKVCPDITRWRETCRAPDLASHCAEGWDIVRAKAEHIREKGELATHLMGTGIFEQCHFLMGFEDTLTNLYEHPAEMHELIDYITDYRLQYAHMVIEGMHPDVILSHDDWGTKDALFMKPEMWREFFKEPYRRLYGYMRSQGVIVVHHADSYLVPIVEDMVEIGINCWQGVLPENDIPALQRLLRGRMILMGGVGAAIDRADAGEDEIRAYVDDVLFRNAPGGHYIPCITYGAPGTVYPQVDPVIDSEIDRYNSICHLAAAVRPAPARRQSAAYGGEAQVSPAENSQAEQGELLPLLSTALRRGQKKRVLTLTEQALQAGIAAADILRDGLVAGMMQLGDDFSAGRVFVPEMLMAARCMTAATELLKPYLTPGSSSVTGRVCLGTVKGDMHDIGKNLVKIMMEGCGLQVIDLGCDVPAETFIETAVREKCDIISCSALLTTTMTEMRRVVQLCCEAGIRDDVIIMIGGAPISQAYCDEIGADIYTADAAAAAQAAVSALAERRR